MFVVPDTAAVYRNEEAIGLALQNLLPKFNLSREDLFLTTKLGNLFFFYVLLTVHLCIIL